MYDWNLPDVALFESATYVTKGLGIPREAIARKFLLDWLCEYRNFIDRASSRLEVAPFRPSFEAADMQCDRYIAHGTVSLLECENSFLSRHVRQTRHLADDGERKIQDLATKARLDIWQTTDSDEAFNENRKPYVDGNYTRRESYRAFVDTCIEQNLTLYRRLTIGEVDVAH